MKLNRLFRWLSLESSNMAIDLGTTNTLIYTKAGGVILDENSMVALHKETKELIEAGKEVIPMLGRTPKDIIISEPLEDGVIADFKVVEDMLRFFIEKVQKKKLFIRPKVLVAVPSGITPVEKKAVINTVQEAGAREVMLVSEPIAGAVGMSLPVKEPTGHMVIDIGGGTTEIAVIALSGIVNQVSIKIAGNELTDSIQTYLYDEYNMAIGKALAEKVKKDIGAAVTTAEDREMEISGRDLVDGLPKSIKIKTNEVYEAMKEALGLIKNAMKKALSETPPELASDIVEKGVFLTGGGALIRGIDKMIQEETDLKVKIADDPLRSVVLGAGIILDNIEENRNLLMESL
ncbi:rod shape-determining protein [candidate division WOR-3 bacterium]|nr:rod shape-determining protein [candidate division WOR-3 bacterium]